MTTNLSELTNAAGPILSLDLGKYKSVACIYHSAEDVRFTMVAAFLHEPKRFKTTKQVSAYGGLVPRQYQSTDTDHRGRITKRGPRTLRKLLVECAWCMLRYNAWARAVYQRLTHGGKTRKKQAIVALARKLLVRCWAMLRDKAAWSDPQTGPKPRLSPSKQRRQAEAQQRRARRQPSEPQSALAAPATP